MYSLWYNPIEEIDENYVLPRPLKKNDLVILRNLGTEGILLEDPDKQGNVTVKSGIAKTKTNISNLVLVTEKKTEKNNKPALKTKAVVSSNFSISIDVRGRNIEDAWMEIDKYFDQIEKIANLILENYFVYNCRQIILLILMIHYIKYVIFQISE